MNPLFVPLISLIFGIWIADRIELEIPMGLSLVLAVSILLSLIILKTIKSKASVYALALSFLLLGGLRFVRHNSQFSSVIQNDNNRFVGQVLRELPSSERFYKFEVEIEPKKPSEKATKLLMYLSQSFDKPVRFERVVFSGKITPIEGVKNPNQFNYRLFMKRKGIFNKVFVKSFGIGKKQSIWARFFRWKEGLTNKMKKHYNREVLLFAESLVLADRSGMNHLERENFSKAGIAHLFALSGLHVGIVFGFFWWLSFPLINRRFRILFSLIGIWVFVAFAGFLPSITRAAFMLSLYLTSRLIYRPLALNDTLIVSAFFLLLFKPNWLWDVGFQLSYVAVFFIGLGNELGQPLISNKPSTVKWILNLGLITFFAQLGTLPLVIYYFHQISLFSVLVNMVAVPLMFIILPVLFLATLLSAFNGFPRIYIQMVDSFFEGFYKATVWVADMQPERLSQIYWPITKVLLAYFLFCSLALFIRRSIKNFLIVCSLSIVLFYASSLMRKEKNLNTHEWILFSERGHAIIGYHRSQFLQIFYTDSARLESAKKFILRDFMIGEQIDTVSYYHLESQNRIPLPQQLKSGSFIININSEDSVNTSYINNRWVNDWVKKDEDFIWNLDSMGARRIPLYP